MAKKRAAERDLAIPIPLDITRRIDAERDPQRWLNVYFAEIFREAWTDDRLAMLHSIIDAALYGGDQAIAGPRGEGKTTIATHAALYLMVRGLSTFPVVIGKSQGKAQLELKSIKEQLQQNELFIADYPEIGVPMQAVGGWSSRARMQTVGGMNTNIELAADHIAFPTIARLQLADWPESFEVASCGQVLYCLGIDGPVRGTKFRNQRPTLAIIDDIEDREAAASEALIEKNEEILEKDVAGLGASSERIPRVMLCTVQNRKCIAYRFTDPQVKPSWRGKDLMETCGLIKVEWDATPGSMRPQEILVDVIGLGAGVVDRLRELNLPVRGINVAELPALDGHRFSRLRDELWWKAREWFEARDCTIPNDEALVDELCGPLYTVTSAGKIQVEPKSQMKRRLGRSPDKADAFCLLWFQRMFFCISFVSALRLRHSADKLKTVCCPLAIRSCILNVLIMFSVSKIIILYNTINGGIQMHEEDPFDFNWACQEHYEAAWA